MLVTEGWEQAPARAGKEKRVRVEAVIFDLDGTLIDSYGAIAECFNHARVSLGFAPLSEPEVRRMVGHGLESLMERAVGPELLADGVRLFRERYDQVCEERTRLLPGVTETVEELHRRGTRLGVATNKPVHFAARLLRALGLMPPIAAVRGPDRDVPPKPDPTMLRRVLGDLQAGPATALYVGDMAVDVETARRAGLRVWLLPTGSATLSEVEEAGADRVLRRFEDLARLLEPTSRIA